VQQGTTWLECTVQAIDTNLDLALLKLPHPISGDIPTLAPPEAELVAVVSSRGQPLQIVRGQATHGLSTLPMQAGHSGGPVYNSAGQLAGLIVAGYGSNGRIDPAAGCLYVHADALRTFLAAKLPK
jgi:hypothetical protein